MQCFCSCTECNHLSDLCPGSALQLVFPRTTIICHQPPISRTGSHLLALPADLMLVSVPRPEELGDNLLYDFHFKLVEQSYFQYFEFRYPLAFPSSFVIRWVPRVIYRRLEVTAFALYSGTKVQDINQIFSLPISKQPIITITSHHYPYWTSICSVFQHLLVENRTNQAAHYSGVQGASVGCLHSACLG